MTGQEIIFACQIWLSESQSTSAQQQSQLYPQHARNSANDIARRTDCIYRTACNDIIAGQVEYAMPLRPYRLGSLCAKDPVGNIRKLASITPEQADKRYAGWRNAQATNTVYSGVPMFYIPQGHLTYKLFPVPNYSIQDGILVAGHYGVDKWWDMGQGSPLPEGLDWDEAIQALICKRRCIEMMRNDSTYASLLPIWTKDSEEKLKQLYSDEFAFDEAHRSFIPSRGERIGAFGNGWGWYG